MTPAEYLDACQQALGVASDYAMQEALGLRKERLSAYRAGKEWPNAYAATRIAIVLNRDPIQVIADLEAQHEKNPTQAEFWRSFLSRVSGTKKAARTLLSIFIVGWLAVCSAANPLHGPGGLFRRRQCA